MISLVDLTLCTSSKTKNRKQPKQCINQYTMLYFSPNYSKHEFPFHRYPQILHWIKNIIINWMSIRFIRNYKQDNCPIATNLERVHTVIHVHIFIHVKSRMCEHLCHVHSFMNAHIFIHVKIIYICTPLFMCRS